MMPVHLFVDISSHGFGHLAQAAPVLDALARLLPGLRLSIRSGLPLEKLRARIGAPFESMTGRSDFGFVMLDAMRVDRAATGQAYRTFHADWEARVAAEATFLRDLGADWVLTDVAYLPLSGAVRAGLPALSMCSLNWADLFAHFFGREAWAGPIHEQILAAYRGAESFIRLTPAMPMNDLPNARAVAPVAALGRDCREYLRERIGAASDERIVLIAFGGFDKDLRAAAWPVTPGVRYLVPAGWAVARSDMTAMETVRMNFTDLLCSVDAVLTKPGYGTFTEAARSGVSVLYVRRDDWPEQDYLIEWLERNARCREVAFADVLNGEFGEVLECLWRQTGSGGDSAVHWQEGAEEAARLIIACLTSRSC
ncbi:MAG: hypothetical protein LBI62_07160 [Candidatus Accumulibacter sp.]|jgi:hypothetical protein|nr:hypothetical protein [Accumulibacter sp.]